MKEEDPLDSILRDWQAPQPTAAMDARVRAAYRAIHHASQWRRIWSARVTIPVPVLAAVMLLIVATLWFQFRPDQPGWRPEPSATGMGPAPANVAASYAGYTTRIETTGFKPLPDGATRVVLRTGARP